MKAYNELEAIFLRWNTLGSAMGILQWDSATMMPSGSGESRGEQLAVLADVCHEVITQPKLPDIFARAEADSASLDDWQQANLREMKHRWQHATSVPTSLVRALTKTCHASELSWREARKHNDFAAFCPPMERVLGLVRESAQAKAEALKLSPYDALLDEYDPGTRVAYIAPLFDDLADFLPGFIAEVTAYQAAQKPPIAITQSIPAAVQKDFGIQFMQKLGFDFTHGRLDESTHPFCGGIPQDIRLTTRYDEQDFLSSFFGIMHETGHALYEKGLPEAWRGQPVGHARGMAFHESQSLLNEMQLCISPDFLHYAAPLMRKTFGVAGPSWEADNIYRLMTRVAPSFIRVDADEVTYPAHVILRYRLERQMIDGTLAVKHVPEAWNEQMRSLLGIVPDSDTNGCLQDIHWPDGTFGYFPTYTLGAMTAAQLFQAARKALPDVSLQIRKGEFAPLWQWLRTHVHEMGSKLSSPELLKHATGNTLDVTIYKQHLKNRYMN